MGLTVTDMGLEKIKSKAEIKKHSATIHCSNTFSLLQRKISNALLYHAYSDLLKIEEHEISIRQLCNLIEYNGNNYSVIKDALRGLLSTVIEWNVVSDKTGVENWTASSILASVSLQGSACYFAYSPRMKQLLHSPSMFGKINLHIQSRFKSTYGLALYENCIRYRGLPHTKWFDTETFRKLMGVPAGNYTIFRDFKRRVLDKSVEEVNTYSDLVVEYELMREKRKVVKVRFLLKERIKKIRLGDNTSSTQKSKESSNTSSSDLKLKMIESFAISKLQADRLMKKYDEEFLLEKFSIVESSKNYQSGKIKNIAAYFMSAIRNDYKKAEKSNDIKIKKIRENKTAKANFQDLKSNVELIESSYIQYKVKLIDNTIISLKDDNQKKFMELFYKYAEGSIKTILKLQGRKYSKKTILKSPQIKGLLREFAFRTLPDMQTIVLPIEKFIDRLSEKEKNQWYQFKLLELNDPIST
ncbi:replication initiation protein [Gammaproteobacteria bacterium]|nr:replication initiation protein [Gammaproteobacteria bacterium]